MGSEEIIAKELDDLQGMYEKTQAKKFENLPPDNYVAVITNMTLKKSSGGTLQLITKYAVIEGDYTDKTVNGFHNIDNEEGWAYTRGFLEILGVMLPTKFSDLQPTLNDFVAAFEGKLRITVKAGEKKDESGKKVPTGFNNVYCNGFVK